MKFGKMFLESINASIKDHLGKKSSSRISSYIVLISIVLNSLVFMIIEIVNAYIMWDKGLVYIVPSEHIWIFGLILSHHLGLLFYKRREFEGTNEYISKSNVEAVKKSMKNYKESNKENEEEG